MRGVSNALMGGQDNEGCFLKAKKSRRLNNGYVLRTNLSEV